MSYDIYLEDENGDTLLLDEKHNKTGGTYVAGGTRECWLNVTYNYGSILKRVIDGGIRSIYGMTGEESIPVLESAISQLDNDVSTDYWADTEGNVREALIHLLEFACLRPEGVWNGD